MAKKENVKENTIVKEDVEKTSTNVKEDTVEIKKTDLDLMLKQLAKQAKDIELLYKTTDKGRLAKELNKEGESLIKNVNVSTWADTGKLIIGWTDMITNISQIVNGREVVDQTTNIIFEDGEVKTVSYLEFARSRTIKLPAEVIGRIEEDGKLKYKLQFPSGKILVIDTRFLN